MRLIPDPLVGRLRRMARDRLGPLARTGAVTDGALIGALRAMDAFSFEAPVEADGLDLGVTAGIVVGAELGRLALQDVYGPAALVGDVLRAEGRPAGAAGPFVLGGMDHAARAVRRHGAAWEMTGRVVLPRDGDESARCCLAADTGGGTSLVLLSPDAWRKRATPLPGGCQSLDLHGLVIGAEEVLGGLDDGVLARARVRQAAYLLGLAGGACEHAAAYARERRQFGRTLMEFQSIAFTLAQAEIALHAVRLSLDRAAWLADSGGAEGTAGEPATAAVGTLAQAAETALRVVRQAVQIHGARGMTREAPVHRFYELARTEATRFGSPSPLWREAGARRLRARPTTGPAALRG
ncbi:acyl-CoA dehydrogenase family protein [Actinomadura sp. GTD37]|uniref:acyl-CoA dehydrogenase family protein n=1 Tax=Actinomadura sp. GTD37 TaxID=1778030 RepID=UPI0035BEB800